METTVTQRITQVIEEKGITQLALAKMVNMNPTTLGRQLKGVQALSGVLIENFLYAFPDVSAEWLIRGENDIYIINENKKGENDTKDKEQIWKIKYDELEKRYKDVLSILTAKVKREDTVT